MKKPMFIITTLLILSCSMIANAARIPLYMDKQSNTAWGITDASDSTGQKFFANSNHANAGDASGKGKNPSFPCSTLDYCVGLTIANEGDWVMVSAGHAESVTAAGGLTLDVAGIRIIGQGNMDDRPTITLSTLTTASIVVGAENITLENVIIDMTGVDAVVAGLDINAAGFTLRNSKIITSDASGQAILGALLDANADNATFDNCEFVGTSDTGTTAAISISGAGVDKFTLTNSSLIGHYGSAGVYGSGASVRMVLKDDHIYNYKSTGYAVQLLGTETGRMEDVDVATGAQATAIDPASLELYNVNFYDYDTASSSAVNIFEPALSSVPADSAVAILAGASGISAFPASAVPANDVSLAEVIRDIWDVLRNGTGGAEPGTNLSFIDEMKRYGAISFSAPNYIAATADMTSATWNTQAAHEILTVTGAIELYVMAECTGTLTDAGDAATLTLGDEITADGIIASTSAAGAGAANQLDTGELWIDATPADVSPVASSGAVLKFVVFAGADVGYTIGGSALTGGSLVFHMWWRPLDATGAAVVGAGGAL